MYEYEYEYVLHVMVVLNVKFVPLLCLFGGCVPSHASCFVVCAGRPADPRAFLAATLLNGGEVPPDAQTAAQDFSLSLSEVRRAAPAPRLSSPGPRRADDTHSHDV